MLLELILFE